MASQTVYQALGIDPAEPAHTDLAAAWAICFGALVLAFPIYSFLVFGAGLDRGRVANILATQVTLCYWLGFSAASWPLPSLKNWSRLRRLQGVCLTFMLVSYLTHLSWELGWLLLHERIAESRDELWAYPWWAYIDGGDVRYYRPALNFIMMEVLSVINGTVGLTGLWLLFRSRFEDYRGTLLCLSTGVTHTVLTWYYYGTEILSGFASVNTHSFFDLWIKFIFLNAPWLVFPWLVMYWATRLLRIQLAR